LAAISGHPTFDAASLEFDFTTKGGNLFFNYVFASEEYNEFVGSPFNDVFAFFLDGNNIALVGGTPVGINTINLGSNSAFYRNNSPGSIDSQYDGFTTMLTAKALGLGAGTHHIKLAIADASDSILDSAVFIQGNTFSDTPTVPEPGTLLLLGSGLAAALILKKQDKKA
jgi:hypothetical protein